jgi:hypothetical protein
MTTNRPNPVFVKQGADVLADLDERDVRVVGADTKKTFLTSLGDILTIQAEAHRE